MRTGFTILSASLALILITAAVTNQNRQLALTDFANIACIGVAALTFAILAAAHKPKE